MKFVLSICFTLFVLPVLAETMDDSVVRDGPYEAGTIPLNLDMCPGIYHDAFFDVLKNNKGNSYFFFMVGDPKGRCELGFGPTKNEVFLDCERKRKGQNIKNKCALFAEVDETGSYEISPQYKTWVTAREAVNDAEERKRRKLEEAERKRLEAEQARLEKEQLRLGQYYTHHQDAMGIDVKASSSVDPIAVDIARHTITIMLKHRSDIAQRMKINKAAVAIIPRKAFITELPEFADISGRLDPNGNPYDSFDIRGAGGIPIQPVTATSEENFFNLKDDKFYCESVLVHEFAHAIMNIGFSDSERNQWQLIYNIAKPKNLFPGAFAMTNSHEYWAELSTSFFSVNCEINTAEYIKRKDLKAFKFLQSVYGDPVSLPRYKSPVDWSTNLKDLFSALSTSQRKEIQDNLKKQGLYLSSIDGLWGRGTFTAIVEFSRRHLGTGDQLSDSASKKALDDLLR